MSTMTERVAADDAVSFPMIPLALLRAGESGRVGEVVGAGGLASASGAPRPPSSRSSGRNGSVGRSGRGRSALKARSTEHEARTVVLIGNPNTGKSTLFGALSGTRQRVGNYPGVTVEKKL